MLKKGIRFVLFLWLICAGFAAQSQNISIGLKGGISIPNLSPAGSSETPVNTGYESRLGPDAALFAQFHLSDAFSIQPMLEYSSQGGKKSGLQAFTTPAIASFYFQSNNQPVPPYLYANYHSEAKLNYLMLPVLAKYELALGGSSFHVYADVGPFVSYLLNGKASTRGRSLIYTDEKGEIPIPVDTISFDYDSTITSTMHRFNAGIEGHLGFSYTTGNTSFFIEGGGNYGFIHIQKNEADGKNNTGAAIVSAGISFRLRRREE